MHEWDVLHCRVSVEWDVYVHTSAREEGVRAYVSVCQMKLPTNVHTRRSYARSFSLVVQRRILTPTSSTPPTLHMSTHSACSSRIWWLLEAACSQLQTSSHTGTGYKRSLLSLQPSTTLHCHQPCLLGGGQPLPEVGAIESGGDNKWGGDNGGREVHAVEHLHWWRQVKDRTDVLYHCPIPDTFPPTCPTHCTPSNLHESQCVSQGHNQRGSGHPE